MPCTSKALILACLFAAVAFSQETRLQISADSTNLNTLPVIQLGDFGRVWISYTSQGSRFVSGYAEGASWNEVANVEIPFALGERNSRNYVLVSQTGQVWCAFLDRLAHLRVGNIANGQFKIVDSVIDRPIADYGLFADAKYETNYYWISKNVITMKKIIDGQAVTNIRTIVDLDTWNHYPNIFLLNPINLPSDSISFTMGYGFSQTLLGGPFHQGTYVNNNSGGTVLELERGSYIGGDDNHPQSIAYPLCSSMIGERLFVLSHYQNSSPYSPPTYRRASAFVVDSIVRMTWKEVIPAVDIDSTIQTSGGRFHKVAVSSIGKSVALVWISHDTLNLKMLRDTAWSVSTSFVPSGLSSLKQLDVAMASDSTVFVAFSAIKNGGQHIFLCTMRPSFVTDTLLTTVPAAGPKPKPTRYVLSQNYPNPFNPSTSIRYELPKQSLLTLRIYNLLGQEVADLVNEYKPAGSYEATWDASRMPSGIYICRLQAGSFIQSKKLVLLK